MFHMLINTLNTIAELPEEERTKLLKISSEQAIGKGNFFLNEGQIPNKFGFVVSGLFRYYYTDRKGNEFTKGFFPEQSILASYSSMIRGSGSFYSIEAIENSNVIAIDYLKWKKLFEDHPCWKTFLINLLEKGYTKKEAREREFLLLNAEERYISFRQEYPTLEKRLKQHHVASYLGITPVALSRIRRKMGVVNIG